MSMSENQYKHIPSVSELLQALPACNLPHQYMLALIQARLQNYRAAAKSNDVLPDRKTIISELIEYIRIKDQPSLRNVINGTGVVLHTGLGRSPIGADIILAVTERLTGYVNLELDLVSGGRGERNDHVAPILSAIVGAEDSIVVNNNAAAVLLTLNTLAEGKEVLVSRGQLVEIGGSFRIPDVIAKSGCRMVEVGTTNRTHLRDYESAINSDTAVLLWAHTSNFVVQGFTAEVSLAELVKLGQKHSIPVVADLGSGALLNLANAELPPEILVADVIAKGVDIVTFSGDKLLGGPQAGLITGKRDSITRIHSNPIYRAVRCDKFILTVLEETLKTFGDNSVSSKNLANNLLQTDRSQLRINAEQIVSDLPSALIEKFGITIIESVVEAGSGSLPIAQIPSIALQFNPRKMKVTELAQKLRNGKIPVVGYIKDNRFYIDLKAVLPSQISLVAATIAEV